MKLFDSAVWAFVRFRRWLGPGRKEQRALDDAKALRARGRPRAAVERLTPLSRSANNLIRTEAVLELIANLSFLRDHQEVLRRVDQLERLTEEQLRNARELMASGAAEKFEQIRRAIIHRAASQAYQGLGKPDEALTHARAAVTASRARLEPGEERQLAERERWVAQLLRLNGQLDQALAAVEVALAECPGHVPSLIAKAACLELLGRKEEGEERASSA